eukprot:m.747794 g.747794  ORF g.747794 m.747794 type:complete len:953 (+) comp23146_c0_seq1:110-2968(+)
MHLSQRLWGSVARYRKPLQSRVCCKKIFPVLQPRSQYSQVACVAPSTSSHLWVPSLRVPLRNFNSSASLLASSTGNDGDDSNSNDADDATDSEDANAKTDKVESKSDEVEHDDDDEVADTNNRKVVPVSGRDDGKLVGQVPVPAEFPEVLVLAVADRPMFPSVLRMMTITDEKQIEQIHRNQKARTPWCGVFFRKPPRDDDADAYDDDDDNHISPSAAESLAEVSPVGTFCRISIMHEDDAAMGMSDKGSIKVLLQGIRRIHATAAVPDVLPLTAEVDNVRVHKYDRTNERIRAYHSEIIKTLRDIMASNDVWRQNVQQSMNALLNLDISDAAQTADFAAGLTSTTGDDLQKILEEPNLAVRLPRVLELLKKEYLQTKLQAEIGKEVEDKMNKRNRTYMLQEQLKVIKKELGIAKDDKDSVLEKFKARLEELDVPPAVLDVVTEEMNKMEFLDPNSSEFNVTRNYLDWLTTLPWGKTTEEVLDIAKAVRILDEDHYGMQDVKDRVLEFIAVGQLRGTIQGKILCFVGPPGVGKTSIGKSIARALNREYYRFSVGGLSDVAEIKGHRRTYVGAMPGKTIQCLKQCQSENPLVMIDEIDKIGRGHNGDPTSALLELLDPEQNTSFLDHYLDVPVDLSKVLFLCTANTTDTIPGPLLDRMEVIQLSGYMSSEKAEIAKQYIIPSESERTGLTGKVSLEDAAVERLIREYCRESGVRNLHKQIEKLYRKSALKIVRDPALKHVTVSADDLPDFVGNPIFTSDELYTDTPAGVVMGLAWTSMGGKSLYVETVVVPSGGDDGKKATPGLATTGQLGDVMRESSQIAYTFSKSMLARIDPGNKFFLESQISMHVPEGATPKDGPSAGVTMATGLLSLALNKPCRQHLAMTGELSLTGKVLRVGGIKEKVLAARRSNVTCLVLPRGNKADFDELPEEVKQGIEVHFATEYQDVFDVAFGN